MNPAMLGIFLSEANKNFPALQAAFPDSGALPTTAPAQEQRAAVSAALQGIRAAARLAAPAELAPLLELLDAVREGSERSAFSMEQSDILAQAVKALRTYCEEIDATASALPRPEPLTECRERLRLLFTSPPTPAEHASSEAAEAAPPPSVAAPAPAGATGSAVDPVMQEMFRTEAEERLAALNENLLRLEENPADAARLEALMRAAHSLKGAARIIGLLPVVKLAHVLEDYFVAAQKGELRIQPANTDVLLAAVDGLARLSSGIEADPQPYLARLAPLTGAEPMPQPSLAAAPAPVSSQPVLASSDQDKTASTSGGPPATAIPAQPAAPAVEVASAVPATPEPVKPAASTEPDEVVRVSAAGISRIMGLAGETVVQAQEMEPLSAGLLQLRRSFEQQLDLLDQLTQELSGQPQTAQLLHRLRSATTRSQDLLQKSREEFSGLARRADDLAQRLYRETLTSRMRPFREGVQGFERMVRDLARQLDKKVRFRILGLDTRVDRDVLSRLEAPLTHLLRNALDHGLQSADERLAAGKSPENNLTLEAVHWAGFLTVRLSDDGRGIDLDRVRRKILENHLHDPATLPQLSEEEVIEFLFLPGFSTASRVSEISGRGVGLDVVRDMLRTLGGQVQVENRPGHGVTFRLRLPVTRSVARVLLVKIGGESFALPLSRIDRLLRIGHEEIRRLEGQAYLSDDGDNIALLDAAALLELPVPPRTEERKLAVVVVQAGEKKIGLRVDQFLGERELVVKPLDPRLGKVRDVSALLVLDDGQIVLLLDVDDLATGLHSWRPAVHSSAPVVPASASPASLPASRQPDASTPQPRPRILVVEDSLTVREMERRLLEQAGYEVVAAVDGMDGWLNARAGRFDLLVSDIDMPRMTGLELVRTLRSDPQYVPLPVILVSYKDREEDKAAGLAAGADHYLTKGGFQDGRFLELVRDLLRQGRPVPDAPRPDAAR